MNSEEIFGDELAMFAKKELQKEVRKIFIINFVCLSVCQSVTLWARLGYLRYLTSQCPYEL